MAGQKQLPLLQSDASICLHAQKDVAQLYLVFLQSYLVVDLTMNSITYTVTHDNKSSYMSYLCSIASIAVDASSTHLFTLNFHVARKHMQLVRFLALSTHSRSDSFVVPSNVSLRQGASFRVAPLEYLP